jgi:hypothetical protein
MYRLVILHYKADGTYETISPYDNGDGTVSFTVTSFSPFIFAELQEEDNEQSKEQIDADESSGTLSNIPEDLQSETEVVNPDNEYKRNNIVVVGLIGISVVCIIGLCIGACCAIHYKKTKM